MSDPSRQEAAKTLGVSSEATSAEARTAFLKLLDREGYLPAPGQLAARQILTGDKLPLPPGDNAELARLEVLDVEAFAKAYWSLPPEARKARWQKLADQSTTRQARARLALLQGGLDVVPVSHEDPELTKLSDIIQQSWTLPSREGLALEMEYCETLDNTTRKSLEARFRTADPALSGLGTDFLARVGTKPPLAAPAYTVTTQIERNPIITPRPPQPKTRWLETRNGIMMLLWIGIMLGVGIIKGIMSYNRSSTLPPYSAYSRMRDPVFVQKTNETSTDSFTNKIEPSNFTDEEIIECERYDKLMNFEKISGSEYRKLLENRPLKYDDWRRAGKPRPKQPSTSPTKKTP
ncbi:MAG: hypothetical protein ACRC8S_21135 [Fimbriiglobus sp.]